MSVRRRLTDKGVVALKPRAARYAHPDPECVGLYIRVTPLGAKSYAAVVRDPLGKQVWTTIGSADHLTIAEARAKAREIIPRVRAGLLAVEPPPPKPESFQAVAESWLKRHVAAKGLRSAGEIERALRKHVCPVWGDREFVSIRRGDVARLLDHVEDHHGSRMADLVLAYVRSIMNWFATRNDDQYTSPVVRGMRRHGGRARDRILSDNELCVIWRAAEADTGQFGAVVRLLLLTGQRVAKVASMRWSDISSEGVWTVPSEAREKGNAGLLPLPPMALDIIRAQPRVADSPFVFSGRVGAYFSMHSRGKAAFDAACGVSGWTIYDCRRSARSLMARAGVRPDIAERVLGHVIRGVEGIYDRHRYEAEKGLALAALAELIATILDGGSDVIAIRPRAQR